MKHFYLYIFGLVVFIFGMSYYNTLTASVHIEYFNNNPIRNYILLGDSVLDNKSFVPDGENIAALLKKQNQDGHVVSLAKNDTTIPYVPPQISKIRELSASYNDSNTFIFLSVGGNDILVKYENNQKPNYDNMIEEYNELIESIKIVAPNAKIYLVDLYFPRNKENQKYWPDITEWNEKLNKYALENNLSIFKVSSILTKPEDFANKIEPSSTGGQKMVDAMLKVT